MTGQETNNNFRQLEQIANAGSYEEALALAKEFGIEIDEEMDARIKTHFNKAAGTLLCDDKLDGVAGGELYWGNGQGQGLQSFEGNVTFAFNVGDVVETIFFFPGLGLTKRGIIRERIIERMGTKGNFRPRYRVELFDGGEGWYLQDSISY